jgi:hypothetical protein
MRELSLFSNGVGASEDMKNIRRTFNEVIVEVI